MIISWTTKTVDNELSRTLLDFLDQKAEPKTGMNESNYSLNQLEREELDAEIKKQTEDKIEINKHYQIQLKWLNAQKERKWKQLL